MSGFRLHAVATVCLLVCSADVALADPKLPAVFSDHMVLQRGRVVPIWGTAAPDEKIAVAINGQTLATTADKDGQWRVDLKPLEAGGPHVLSVRGTKTVEFEDVLVGEVWVGSGQSNMAGGVNGYMKNDEVLAELANGAYPKLRLCRGKGGGWQEATPQAIKGYSALLFSFGQRLQGELDVPVGLVLGAVGGTPSGRWLTEEMLERDEGAQSEITRLASDQDYDKAVANYDEALAEWEKAAAVAKASGGRAPRRPVKPVRVGEIRSGRIGDLYAAHIQPIVPYGIRGVLWDQGESGTALQGLDQFTVMGGLIGGWRETWGQGEFPFLYVQKPSGGGCAWNPTDPITRNAEKFTSLPAAPEKGNAAAYRVLHTRIMQHPNTAMVTARDLGSGVHPTNKSGYGQRAARVALGHVYDRDVEIYGPLYESHEIVGKQARVKFRHVGQGLAWKHGEGLQGFEIAGADGVFRWAEAKIDGDEVVVSSTKVSEPVAVRYAWSRRSPWANLFNQDGLPALAFRTSK